MSHESAMAFGTELQGQKSHEVLLALQDAEIRMLETVKKYVVQRIKCDRDYALALSSIITVAQKPDPTPTGLPTEMVKLILSWKFLVERCFSVKIK